MVKRRKTKVAPPPQACPLSECMRVLGAAWASDVIWYLREGDRCFTELQHDIGGVSAKVLTTRLRALERERIVERHTRATSPPTVWYSLSPVGRELSEALVNVVHIAQRLRTQGGEV